jgi:acetolactate synthase-1/2/3 large subunit
LDLTGPEIDYVGLARALGVEARRITEPNELKEQVAAAWTRTEPILFEVPIQRAAPERLNY